MRRRFLVALGFGGAVVAIGLSKSFSSWSPKPYKVAVASDGRSIPNFLNTIDNPAHISRWQGELRVTADFLRYCQGMSISDIIAFFDRDDHKRDLPDEDGASYYIYPLRPGDMGQLVSHLSHFPFSIDSLEFWTTITATGTHLSVDDAKIIDTTAYP